MQVVDLIDDVPAILMIPVLFMRHMGLTLRVWFLHVEGIISIGDESFISLDSPCHPYLCRLLKI